MPINERAGALIPTRSGDCAGSLRFLDFFGWGIGPDCVSVAREHIPDLMKLIKRILVFLLVFVALFAVAGHLLPAQYHVERSTVVKASSERVFGIAADLGTWEEWTAWNLKMDPTMKRTFSGPASGAGAAVSWDGKKSGHGEMTLTKVTPPTEFTYDLSFEHGRFKSVGTM